ncbi:Transposon Ty3-I Gag-Pol polyprotein [Senna tora]|uniref:Transposon Ty3-I Gag-Pol polyprotein n=1 Tax=Senna tora TaxID=362788 RepID=A0A835C5J3_9FABA|nr:Transposon Ty3-I Gag-Pol polyprotein [Senna tora]
MANVGDQSNGEGNLNNFEVTLNVMREQFERMNVVFREMRDRLDRQEERIVNLQENRPNRRRRHRRRKRQYKINGNEEEFESPFDMGSKHGYRRRRSKFGNIKLKIPPFPGEIMETPVTNWREMKTLLRRRFIPSHYYRELYQRLQNIAQGSNCVEEYYKKMELYMIRANVQEDREATMAQFLNRLNKEIAYIVDSHHYVELEDMVHMAIKVEQVLHLNRIGRREKELSKRRPLKAKKKLYQGAKRVMILKDSEVVTDNRSDGSMPSLVDGSDLGIEYVVKC